MTLSRLRIQKCLVRPVPWTEDRRDRYLGLTLFVSVGTLTTIWAAESIAMHWWDILIAFVAFKNCLWTVMLLIPRSHMSVMCRAGLCSVCKYLQGQARDNLQQSVTPAPGSAGPEPPEPGPELATLTAAPADGGDDIEIWLCPGHQDIGPGVPRPPRVSVCTFQLYPGSSQAPALTCCVCPGLAWPELVNVRELGQWQRAKWNDITHKLLNTLSTRYGHRLFCRRPNNFIELGLFFKLD